MLSNTYSPERSTPGDVRGLAAKVRAPFRWAAVVILGTFTLPLLAALWHLCGLASHPVRFVPYRLSEFLAACFGWPFFVAFFVLTMCFGWLTRYTRTAAFTLASSIPIAFVIETLLDPTSHNLFPFEVVFVWLPIFILVLLGLYTGKLAKRLLRSRAERRIRPAT